MTLHCVGHSHLKAIVSGARERGLPVIPYSLRGSGDEGKKPAHILVRDTLAALTVEKPERILCFVGGGVPAILGIPQHPTRFDFQLPWRPDLPVDRAAQIIPYDAIKALVEKMVATKLSILADLRHLPVPLAQFETPPPIFDNETIAEIFRTLKRVPQVKPAAAHPDALSSPWLRLKIWALHSRIFEEFCQAHGIAYIKNPGTVQTEAGFLAPGLWSDFVHGNAAYGAAVLEHVLESERAGRAHPPSDAANKQACT